MRKRRLKRKNPVQWWEYAPTKKNKAPKKKSSKKKSSKKSTKKKSTKKKSTKKKSSKKPSKKKSKKSTKTFKQKTFKQKTSKSPKTGAELKKWRLKYGLTQIALAKLMKVEQPIISRWELGSKLPVRALDKLRKINFKTQKNLQKQAIVWPPKTGTQLRDYRKFHNLTQGGLAKRLGIHQPQISLLEKERVLPPEIISQLPQHPKVKSRAKKTKKMKKRASGMTGAQLREIRLDLGLNQTQFGNKLGLLQSVVSIIERGDFVSESISKLARSL